jgi:transposase InsO family protein
VVLYEVVKGLSEEFKIHRICEVLGVSRSAYYAYISGQSYVLKADKQRTSEEIKRIFAFHKRRYGWRRIQGDLQEVGIEVGRYQIRSRMREQNLIAIQPKSFVPKTTQSHPHLKRSANLLLEAKNLPSAPAQVIVGDITYLPNQEAGYGKWLYLATWQDLFSRRIVGWQIERHLEASLVYTAMEQVLRTIQPQKGLIVHSDGGGQYGASTFRELLNLYEFRQSMTRKENHYDNAHAESLFSRFKAELLDGGVFYGLEDAYLRSFDFIEGYYNTIRRHSALGNISPLQFEQQFNDRLK